jgi:transposase InsO family protein
MSRKGECRDNTPMERFFGSLISEWVPECGAHNINVESEPQSGKETAATEQSGGGEQAFLSGDMSRQCVHQVRGQAVMVEPLP